MTSRTHLENDSEGNGFPHQWQEGQRALESRGYMYDRCAHDFASLAFILLLFMISMLLVGWYGWLEERKLTCQNPTWRSPCQDLHSPARGEKDISKGVCV
jgi:hypothetical protein